MSYKDKEKKKRRYKEYYELNREKILAKHKEYREENSEKVLETRRKYKESLPEGYYTSEQYKQYRKTYRNNNADKIKAYATKYRKEKAEEIRIYKKQYQLDFPGKIRKYKQKYYLSNIDKIREYNLASKKKRDKLKNSKFYWIIKALKKDEFILTTLKELGYETLRQFNQSFSSYVRRHCGGRKIKAEYSLASINHIIIYYKPNQGGTSAELH